MQGNTMEKSKGSLIKRGLTALGVVLLTAVPVLALTTLAADSLPARQGGTDGQQAVNNLGGPFTYDRPAVAVRSGDAQESDAPVVLKDWQFTRSTPSNLLLFEQSLFSLFEQNPAFYIAFGQQVPALVSNFKQSFNNLTPQQQALLLAFAVYEINYFKQHKNPASPHQ